MNPIDGWMDRRTANAFDLHVDITEWQVHDTLYGMQICM